MTIAEIIKRLEAGDAGLDINEAIARLAGWTFQKMERDAKPYWREPGVTEWFRRSRSGPPQYTASLDAALTLVPAGRYVKLQRGRKGGGWAWVEFDDVEAIGYSESSPALALVIAALKARESRHD